jgi:hypothetical protein
MLRKSCHRTLNNSKITAGGPCIPHPLGWGGRPQFDFDLSFLLSKIIQGNNNIEAVPFGHVVNYLSNPYSFGTEIDSLFVKMAEYSIKFMTYFMVNH